LIEDCWTNFNSDLLRKINLVEVEILFVAVTLNKAVITTDETDASCISMTKVYKKIVMKNGAIVTDAPLKLLSSKLKI